MRNLRAFYDPEYMPIWGRILWCIVFALFLVPIAASILFRFYFPLLWWVMGLGAR